ncbi:MAG: hypothetical protein PHP59_00695 [Methanofollis sp.]|uniref:hypothetical protein n=1 Tax=Methanofollis sp. TaxID=2052835 RepID=UPI00262D6412|nr:hypothetical protein [Methanofollis sp.]MDD4253879.1 hypothetical protein [Methanofollis sp.]
MVSHGGGLISLVFSEGACILAEYQGLLGAAALQAVQSMGEETAEIGLYLLTRQQLRLADEFNRNARVASGEPPARSEGAQAARGAVKAQQTAQASPGKERLVVPRGELCEVKKDVATAEILERLKERAFTGYGLFTLASVGFTLVFSGGSCILAAYGRERGAAALEKAKASGAPGDVGLYTLTLQQIALSLEFNGGYRVEGPPRTEVRSMAGGPPLSQKGAEAPAMKSRPALPPRGGAAGPAVPSQAPVREDPKGTDPDSSMVTAAVMRDLDALDAIDPVQMAANLKNGYVSILGRLQLGHLVDEKKKKEV